MLRIHPNLCNLNIVLAEFEGVLSGNVLSAECIMLIIGGSTQISGSELAALMLRFPNELSPTFRRM